MAIIIFAQNEPEEPTATPVAPVATQPQPPQATTPAPGAPAPVVTQQQPGLADLIKAYLSADDAGRQELKKQIYSFPAPAKDKLNAISDLYRGGAADDALQLVYSFPKENYGTIGRWFEIVLRQHWENPKEEAQLAIFDALRLQKPGDDLMKQLGVVLFGRKYKNDTGVVQQDVGRNMLEAAHALEPYLVFLRDPNAAKARKIDEDVMQNFHTDEDRVWEQYKRDAWRDKDENGPGRVARAKQWFVDQLRQLKANGSAAVSDKEVEHVINDNTIQQAIKILPVNQQVDAAKVKSRLLYLKKPSMNRRKIYVPTKAMSDPAWMQVADLWLRENGISDAQKYTDALPGFDDWLIKRLQDAKAQGVQVPEELFLPQMDARWFRNAEKALIAGGVNPSIWRDKTSPNWLTTQMIDPSEGGISKNYIPDIKRLMSGDSVSLDAANEEGQTFEVSPDMVQTKNDTQTNDQMLQQTTVSPDDADTFMGTMPAQQKEQAEKFKELIKPSHPKFKETVKYIVRNLYSPFAGGMDDTQQRTQAVLSEIGNFYSNLRYTNDPASMGQARSMNDENHQRTYDRVKSLLEEPLSLKHVQDEAGLPPQQRFGLALREFMMDVFDWLAVPQNQQALQQTLGMDQARVASLKNNLRAFAFVYSAKSTKLSSLSPYEIETVIDKLFGDGPKAAIARIVCRSKDPHSKDTFSNVNEEIKKRFPQEYRIMKNYLLQMISNIVDQVKTLHPDKSEA